ncbi:tetratricopeptide repeat protein, partial [Massilia sp. ST3]|nr:tetratricopeptide repeat protein [Massilia sp. ST3]
MEHNCIPLPPLDTAGEVTTFYAYEGGAARNAMLSALAQYLAGARAGACGGKAAGAPVLVIDWDFDAPALHRHFDLAPAGGSLDAEPGADIGCGDEAGAHAGPAPCARPGLIEFFEACSMHLRQLRHEPAQRAGAEGGAASDETLAERVLDAVDWREHIERADGRRPLYLMRAGRFDDSYAERSGRFDWEALFGACPALFRRFGARMARHFSHVLVASRPGRSPAVSVCTTLLADRLVGLFTPAPGSVEGFEGVVRRAIEYRCSHEEEQRPLLVYPLACAPDGARSDPHQRWRRGDARLGAPGYQPRIEVLLRACYGWPRVNLDSYFDELQLPLADAMSTAGPGTDRRALARIAGLLAEWVAPGRFPWQSLEEIRLRAAVARARSAAFCA